MVVAIELDTLFAVWVGVASAAIADVPVEYISLEDGGDTTRAVQNIKKLVQESNIDGLIGPSTTPNALAILGVIAEAKVPMMATVGTSAVVEPIDDKKRWVFKTTQNDDLIAAALLKYMTKNNVKTIAFIGFSDPYGENWLKVFSALAEKSRIKVAVSIFGRFPCWPGCGGSSPGRWCTTSGGRGGALGFGVQGGFCPGNCIMASKRAADQSFDTAHLQERNP